MRRRRQKNTLLPKMLGLAVLVNAVLLPILAQLGVFKGMKGQRLTPVQLVQAPPPPPRPKTPSRAKPHVAHRRQTARRAAPRPAERVASGPKVRVVATPSTGAGSSGAGDSGITTSEGPTGGAPPIAPPPTTPPVANPPPVAPPPPTTPPVTPLPAAPPPSAPPPPHVPVLVPASVENRVEPQIPADFADENLPVTFRAAFHVHTDGTATVETVASTGDRTLDQLALAAARRWTFHPATEDGKAVDSYLRLTVNFLPNDPG